MLEPSFKKEFIYSAVSFLSIGAGAFLVFLIGFRFEEGSETDYFFLSITVLSYLGYVVQSLWSSFLPVYSRKRKLREEARIYRQIITVSFVFPLILLVFYYFSFWTFVSNYSREIYIINIMLLNSCFYSSNVFLKTVLVMENGMVERYVAVIIQNVPPVLVLLLDSETSLQTVAWGYLIGSSLAFSYGVAVVTKKSGLKFYPDFSISEIKPLITGSLKLNVSALLKGGRDLVIAAFLVKLGDGFYSIYSYGSKIVSSGYLVLTGPILERYNSKGVGLYTDNRIIELKKMLGMTLSRVLTRQIAASLASVIVFVVILEYLVGVEQFKRHQDFVWVLCWYFAAFYTLQALEYLYMRVGIFACAFSSDLLINSVAAVLVFVSYYYLDRSGGVGGSLFLSIIFIQLFVVFLAYLRKNYLLSWAVQRNE